jgi:hypothetical protein
MAEMFLLGGLLMRAPDAGGASQKTNALFARRLCLLRTPSTAQSLKFPRSGVKPANPCCIREH